PVVAWYVDDFVAELLTIQFIPNSFDQFNALRITRVRFPPDQNLNRTITDVYQINQPLNIGNNHIWSLILGKSSKPTKRQCIGSQFSTKFCIEIVNQLLLEV